MGGDGVPEEPLGRVRAAVITALHEGAGGAEALAPIGDACVELLPVDGISISVISGTRNREMLYASDEVSTRIETLQFSLGEGPCFEAHDTRCPVLVPDLAVAAVPSWPVFAAELAVEPVGAIFAFPLLSGVISIGALDMYRHRPCWLSSAEVATALRLVDIVALALPQMPTASAGDRMGRASARGQEQVYQATGMLIAAHSIAAADALALLRSYAFANGRMVGDVAGDIVSRRLPAVDVTR